MSAELEDARCADCGGPLTETDKADLAAIGDADLRARILRRFVCWDCIPDRHPGAMTERECERLLICRGCGRRFQTRESWSLHVRSNHQAP